MNHPDKLNNFAVWLDGDKLLGIVDATLPNLTPLKETSKGAGIAGEFETRAIGHYGTLKLQMTWRRATSQAYLLANPEGKTLELRAAGQVIDSEAYAFKMSKIRVVIRASGSDLQAGKFDPATAMGTTTEVECLYLKVEEDGEVLVEIDKLNFKSVINGEDELEEVRSILGE
jgi:P2 family phage contractile tail tube protein